MGRRRLGEIQNPKTKIQRKSERRNPKSESLANDRNPQPPVWDLKHSDFEVSLSFGFWILDLNALLPETTHV
jgi:hypothetical protein